MNDETQIAGAVPVTATQVSSDRHLDDGHPSTRKEPDGLVPAQPRWRSSCCSASSDGCCSTTCSAEARPPR